MSRNSLRDIQYNNMHKMVDHYLYEYRCDMELRIHESECIVYERESENKRKRKVVSEKYNKTEYLIVHGNGSEYICAVIKNDNGNFEIYAKCYPWGKDSKPTYITSDFGDANKRIEQVCREHYLEKYGDTDTPYSRFGKTRKRLSVQEICDWYNQFRKLGMSISDVKSALQECSEIKKENEEYKRLLLGVAKKKGII